MKKIVLLIVTLLGCALLLASCGGKSCPHENSRGGVCLDCGERFGFFKEYTITFETPDGIITEVLYAGEEITWPEFVLPEGFEFRGWYMYSKDGGEFLVSDGAEKKTPVDSLRDFNEDGKITLTAVVEAKYWSITYVNPFNAGDVAGSNPRKYQTGQTVQITNAHGFGVDYDLVGWYFDEQLTQPATVISGKTEDITLYPKVYYLPFDTITELDNGSVALSGLRPSYPTWNENGNNTLIIPETYRGKTIATASVNGNYSRLVIESKDCIVSNLPAGLNSVDVCDDHKTYKSVDGSLYSKDGTVLYRLCLPKNTMFVEIPEGVTTIAKDAIAVAVKRITLPSTLTTIEEDFGEVFEIYNLSENISLTIGSKDYGYIAYYAKAIHTDKNAKSIFTDIDEFVFLDIEGVQTLMGYLGSDTVITLPDTFVYDIYENAFHYTNVTEITVSAGVRKIEHGVFPASLQKITFDGMGVAFLGSPFAWTGKTDREVHVKSIEQWLSFTFEGSGSTPFSNNDAGLYINGTLVTDVVVPDGTSIPSYAFHNYQHIRTLNISDGVEKIESYAFEDCTQLTSVTLPADLIKICSSAFDGCTSLVTIELPNGLQILGSYAFDGCESLMEITSDGAKYIGAWLVGVTENVGDTLTIREGTVGIADNAISSNSIKTVTIPESVKYIGSRAITGKNIEIINYNAINAVTNGEEIFYHAGMNGNGITVNVGTTVQSIPANLFGGDLASGLVYGTYAAKVKNVVFLGNAVKSIGDSAFRGAIYLESITLPKSLESIGNSAFLCCYALKSINIPENVKAITSSAFRNCTALESIYYYAKNASVESSSSNALFGGAGSSADTCVLTIGSKITSIPDYIFYNTQFTSVVFENDAACTYIGEYAFWNNDRLVSVDLPSSVDTLGEYSFAYCDSLTTINGTGLANVHEKAIYESRNMPDDWGYEVYGNIKYYFKTALEPVSNKITWARFKPGSVIPDGFFQYCTDLQHVYVPEGCTLGNEMFKINSFSNIDKRLTLRVFFEDNDYEGSSAWRNIITHDGTEYKLGMVVSVNGENDTLGTFKYNVPISTEGFAYVLDTKTTPPVATVLGYFATSESLTVGGQIDGYTIYDIDDYAFYMHDGIGEAVVSVEIGDMAFAASNIKRITLVDVDDVGVGTFMACSSLIEADLGTIEEIGAYAFNGCTMLSIVRISESTEHNAFIRDYAFAGCTSLSEITLPANIVTIATGAFSQSGLVKINSTQVSEWYIISDAASTNPNIVSTYTVTTPEALATALVTTYADYYWANKELV